MKTALIAIALLLAAASAAAQTIHTTVGPDGHRTFSDLAGTAPVSEQAPAVEPSRAPAGTMANGSRRAAVVNASEARRRLDQARVKRMQGAQPLPGELAVDQGAGVALDRYWRRQEKLRLAEEKAQRRSNETSEQLRTIR